MGYLTLIPGLMEHRSRIVLARDLYESRLPGDEPEELDVIKWPLDDLVTLIQREDFSEGRSIAALYMVRDLLAAGKLDGRADRLDQHQNECGNKKKRRR